MFPMAFKTCSHPTYGLCVRGEKREEEGFSEVDLGLGIPGLQRWRQQGWKAQG